MPRLGLLLLLLTQSSAYYYGDYLPRIFAQQDVTDSTMNCTTAVTAKIEAIICFPNQCEGGACNFLLYWADTRMLQANQAALGSEHLDEDLSVRLSTQLLAKGLSTFVHELLWQDTAIIVFRQLGESTSLDRRRDADMLAKDAIKQVTRFCGPPKHTVLISVCGTTVATNALLEQREPAVDGVIAVAPIMLNNVTDFLQSLCNMYHCLQMADPDMPSLADVDFGNMTLTEAKEFATEQHDGVKSIFENATSAHQVRQCAAQHGATDKDFGLFIWSLMDLGYVMSNEFSSDSNCKRPFMHAGQFDGQPSTWQAITVGKPHTEREAGRLMLKPECHVHGLLQATGNLQVPTTVVLPADEFLYQQDHVLTDFERRVHLHGQGSLLTVHRVDADLHNRANVSALIGSLLMSYSDMIEKLEQSTQVAGSHTHQRISKSTAGRDMSLHTKVLDALMASAPVGNTGQEKPLREQEDNTWFGVGHLLGWMGGGAQDSNRMMVEMSHMAATTQQQMCGQVVDALQTACVQGNVNNSKWLRWFGDMHGQLCKGGCVNSSHCESWLGSQSVNGTSRRHSDAELCAFLDPAPPGFCKAMAAQSKTAAKEKVSLAMRKLEAQLPLPALQALGRKQGADLMEVAAGAMFLIDAGTALVPEEKKRRKRKEKRVCDKKDCSVTFPGGECDSGDCSDPSLLISDANGETSICFPGTASVQRWDANVGAPMATTMASLNPGDWVLGISTDGQHAFHQVMGFAHRVHSNSQRHYLYHSLQLEDGHVLEATGEHLVPVGRHDNLVQVAKVAVGDTLQVSGGGWQPVVKVSKRWAAEGIYAPVLSRGESLFVGGVLASHFAHYESISVGAMRTMVWLASYLPTWVKQWEIDGAHVLMYPIDGFNKWMSGQSTIVRLPACASFSA